MPARADNTAPWLEDTALLKQVQNDLASQGIKGVATYAEAMDKALAQAPQSTALAHDAGFVLTDGPADTLLGLMTAATAKDKKSVAAVANPYPHIGLYLGSYYDEIGRKDDALRVLDEGLAISQTSSTRPFLLIERGAALNGLHRPTDALADFEDALKIPDIDVHIRAAMMRGRGFALTELNRLDEAEAAYQDSLKAEPGNPRAENELRYIAKLRAGGAHVEGSYTAMGAKVDASGKVQGTPDPEPPKP
jgi:tetratricopeptide (TPR) repeat protein